MCFFAGLFDFLNLPAFLFLLCLVIFVIGYLIPSPINPFLTIFPKISTIHRETSSSYLWIAFGSFTSANSNLRKSMRKSWLEMVLETVFRGERFCFALHSFTRRREITHTITRSAQHQNKFGAG